ncbi:MAG: S8 family serine peptidase [Acidimicrobiia bacterium]
MTRLAKWSVPVVAAAGTLATLPAAAPAGAAPLTESVIVRTAPGSTETIENFAEALGATVTRELPLIDGFAARMPTTLVDTLSHHTAVVAVTADAPVRPLTFTSSLGYDPTRDMGSLSAITRITGAQDLWKNGITGQGIDVAVIDTGVTPVAGLTGKVIDGPDLSFDSQEPGLVHLDAYGHGTHMASIIAGNDFATGSSTTKCTTCLTSSIYSDTTKFVGVAPNARIVNVKVGSSDGATDVSQVIAAIDWVVQHARDPGFNMRVINLSFGTNSLQSYITDPLAFAAEAAWKKGIVVVAAAGNDGNTTIKSLTSPAYDPMILAVGADDPMGTLSTSDDVVPTFASHGLPIRPVDVIAPGTHVLGLNVPGSYVDQTFPTGLVGTRFLRGSGTSQAAAVTSGLVALLLQKYPAATPNEIKSFLKLTATPLDAAKTMRASQYPNVADLDQVLSSMGAGVANVSSASATTITAPTLPSTKEALGTGPIEVTRGNVHVAINGVELVGEKDIFGKAWNGAVWRPLSTAGRAWTGGTWNGSRWTGDGWTGSRWTDAAWSGTTWTGSRWSSTAWTGNRWTGSRWTGSRWSGSRWSGSRWSGSRWSGAAWA